LTCNVEKVAKGILKMPVRIGRPAGVTGLIDEIQGPEFAATVGAILYGANMLKSTSLLSFSKGHGKINTGFSKLIEKFKSFLP
jgi:cell division ATPase FtsA